MADLEERRQLATVATSTRRSSSTTFRGTPTIFAVPVNASGAAFESGVPQRLVLPAGLVIGGADVASDGQRFLIAVHETQGTARASIRVVLDWPALLTK